MLRSRFASLLTVAITLVVPAALAVAPVPNSGPGATLTRPAAAAATPAVVQVAPAVDPNSGATLPIRKRGGPTR
ncbi:MAG: hypothetical protein M3072_00805 [Candidatus Dormibacteraeota bacterium]|nr:hypothetical protein [Candidatus Dormibacteraeota bacterium]